jgi:hypothetical protein
MHLAQYVTHHYIHDYLCPISFYLHSFIFFFSREATEDFNECVEEMHSDGSELLCSRLSTALLISSFPSFTYFSRLHEGYHFHHLPMLAFSRGSLITLAHPTVIQRMQGPVDSHMAIAEMQLLGWPLLLHLIL